MELVFRDAEREARAAHLTRPYAFTSPFDGEDFALLVVAQDSTITPDEQWALSCQFVTQGCRYAVCWGHECTTWDDSIDFAAIETGLDADPPTELDVETTWHERETLDEAAWFFVQLTRHDDFVATRFVTVTIGGDAATHREAVEAQLRYFADALETPD